jgi:hypothetical protein
LFTAVLVTVQIALTILKTGYDQPLVRIFRNKFFRRRLKETTSVSISTPTHSKPGKQHTASMLCLVEGLSLPTRNATFSFGLFTAVS